LSVEPALLAGEKAAPAPKRGLSGRLARDGGIIFGGVVILFAGVKVLVNLMIDISYVFFDPRIRY